MNRGPSSKKLKQGPTLHLVGESSADEFLRIRIVGIGAFGERMSHELQSRNLAEQLPNATVYFDTIALGVLTQYEEVMGSKTDEHIRIGIVELGRTTLDSFGWMFEMN